MAQDRHDRALSSLSDKELGDRISSTLNTTDVEEHISLITERSRRAGFDIEQSLECILDVAQRKDFMAYGDLPDQLARSWPERRYQVPGHLQDLILNCHAHDLPLVTSVVVEKENIKTGNMGSKALSGFTAAAMEAGYEIDNPSGFVKEQQRLTHAYAAKAPRVQRAFVLTWKESGWPISELEALLARFDNDKNVIEPWRFQAHRQCSVDDRVYALRQGEGPKVIFGAGQIVGDAYQQDWNGNLHWVVPVRFDQLVHPYHEALVDEPHVKATLPSQIIRHQASGVSISRSAALGLDMLITARSQAGEDWNERELNAIVPDYFEMLKAEIAGEPYRKSEHRSELMRVISRSPGAIEFKHQNISAILEDFGKIRISGYQPRPHKQHALVSKVATYLDANRDLDVLITPTNVAASSTADATTVFEPPPKSSGRPRNRQSPTPGRSNGYDSAKRDWENKALGSCGEEFVVDLERRRLESLGLATLAKKVEWVASTKGDGLGYDVLSFEEGGSELWIEVKTTNGSKVTPFYITKRELEVASQNLDTWCLYRVYRFASSPKVYIVRPPLKGAMHLEPISWRVWP